MITKIKDNKEKTIKNKIELSPWKTPLDYREKSVKLPKTSKIDKWD